MHHTHLHKVIFVLTGVTAVVHLRIGWLDNDQMLLWNGVGYAFFLGALLIPYTARPRYHDLVRGVLTIYTLITLVGYFVVHNGIPRVLAHGESAHSASAESLAEPVKPDWVGLGVKGVEFLLLVALVADVAQRRNRERRL